MAISQLHLVGRDEARARSKKKAVWAVTPSNGMDTAEEKTCQHTGLVSVGQSCVQDEEEVVNVQVCLGAGDLSPEFSASDPSRCVL